MIGRLAEVERGVRIVLLGREVEVPGEAFREARFLRLGPLPATEAEALLESREVPAGNPAVLARAAGGNPLFLELLASAPDPVAAPGDLAAFVARVLAPSLAPAERETLRWASALRAPFDSGLIARLGIGSRAALDHLARASLLERRDDGRYGMHDVVRDAVYPTIDSAELRSMHERVAEAYRPRAGTGGDVAEFLHHLVAADRRDDALRWVLRNQSRLLARAREVFRAGGGRA